MFSNTRNISSELSHHRKHAMQNSSSLKQTPPPPPQQLSLFHTASLTDLSEEHVVLHDADVNGEKARLQRGAESVALLTNHAHIIPVIWNTKQQKQIMHPTHTHKTYTPLTPTSPNINLMLQLSVISSSFTSLPSNLVKQLNDELIKAIGR